MAKATTEKVETTLVTLTMNMDEAKTLTYILNCVGGCSNNSARKHADSLQEAMEKVVSFDYDQNSALCQVGRNSLYFRDGAFVK